MTRDTVIVTGFGRCGSSMLMQMLEAGGMPVFAKSRASYEADEFAVPRPMNWNPYIGYAVKALDPHRWSFPPEGKLRFIFISRDANEQAKSHGKLLRAVGLQFGSSALAGVRKSLVNNYGKVPGCFRPHPYIVLCFEDILRNPQMAAEQIAEHLNCGLAIDRMAKVVQRRRPECARDMAYEFSRMAEVAPPCPAHIDAYRTIGPSDWEMECDESARLNR